VLESQAQQIRVFDTTGAHVRTIGRKGSGPGEFRQAIGFAWDPHGRLWIVDQENVRYTVIDTAGHLLFTRPRPISGWYTWRWEGGVDTAGRICEWYRKPGTMSDDMLLRYDSTFASSDTFRLPSYRPEIFKVERENMRSYATVPFTPILIWAFDPRGYVWFGVSAPYRVYQRALAGDTVQVFERPYERIPVTAAERDSAVKQLDWFVKQGGEIDPSRLPDHKPAFNRFIVDDGGRLWVMPVTTGEQDRRVFDVFTSAGRYQGRVRGTVKVASGSPLLIRGSSVYGVTVDEDGVPYVIRARFDH
jgi:6-bladed beta-propeller protein